MERATVPFCVAQRDFLTRYLMEDLVLLSVFITIIEVELLCVATAFTFNRVSAYTFCWSQDRVYFLQQKHGSSSVLYDMICGVVAFQNWSFDSQLRQRQILLWALRACNHSFLPISSRPDFDKQVIGNSGFIWTIRIVSGLDTSRGIRYCDTWQSTEWSCSGSMS